MPEKVTKVTTLEGFYATSDRDREFCFDRHAGPDDHDRSVDADPRWGMEEMPVNYDPNECRVYARTLVPPEARRRRGRWTITVVFEPYNDEN